MKKPLISILFLYIIISFIIFIVGYSYFINEKEFLIKDRYNELNIITDDKLQHISQWLENKNREAELLKITNPLINLFSAKRSNIKLPIEVLNWLDSIKTNLTIDNILFIDDFFHIIYNSDISGQRNIIYDSSLFKQTLTTGKVVFSDQQERKSTNTDLRFYIPVNNKLKRGIETTGVLILTFDPIKNLNELVELPPYKLNTLETLIFRPAVDSIVYLNSSKFAKNGTKIRFPIKDKVLVTVKAVAGSYGILEGLDYKNDEVIALIKKIPYSSLFLVTKINKSELYGPIAAFARLVFLISISSELLLALIFTLIWRKLIITNYKKLYQAELDKIKSEIKYKTLLDQIKDYAIFILDINGNISSWNKGAEQIYGYSANEIIGKSYTIFFSENNISEFNYLYHLSITAAKGRYEDEGWRYKKNGTTFWANVILTGLTGSSNKIENFISITRDLTERKKVESRLLESEFELRKLTAQIQFAREAERQNIAREVHDQLGQFFTGINLTVSYLMDTLGSNKKISIEQVLNELSIIKTYIDQGVEKVRDISGKLRSYILDHLGLVPAIQEYCREIERISNLKCRVNCSIDSLNLDNDRNITLFRIIQEALTNVIRHADANEVILEISHNEDKLCIIISDNGKGIKGKNDSENSMGLLGMKERAIYLNGELEILSTAGSGTSIHLQIPY